MSTKIQAAETIYFLRGGQTILTDVDGSVPQFVTATRGMGMTLTDKIISANTDRNGFCWLSLVDDDAAQIARWGFVTFRGGSAPDGLTAYLPNSVEEDLARDAARSAAYELPLADQPVALRKVNGVFGMKTTSTTIGETR